MDGKWTGNDDGEKRLMVPWSNNRPETHPGRDSQQFNISASGMRKRCTGDADQCECGAVHGSGALVCVCDDG